MAERRLGEDLKPPQELAVFVGRSRAAKAITTPLEVEPILALVRAIPDASWRFAFPLMAAYGLRPEKRQHLQIRQGRLWCMDEKVACRGKTRPRVLRPLPCDDWADGGRLEERFPTQELSPMQPGLGGGYGGHYLMNRPLWKVLRPEYEAKGEKVVAARWGTACRPTWRTTAAGVGMIWWMKPSQKLSSAWDPLQHRLTAGRNGASVAKDAPLIRVP